MDLTRPWELPKQLKKQKQKQKQNQNIPVGD